MSFFFTNKSTQQFPKKLLWQLQCKACPLYNLPDNGIKDIQPYGFDGPNGIICFGLGPGELEAKQGKFWVGPSGDYLKSHFTPEQLQFVSYNNVVRTKPVDNNPSFEAIESCRPSVEKDISLRKPYAIFALGGVALNWFLGKKSSIDAWRSHKFPANIAGHSCWVFPMYHPAHILRAPERTLKPSEKNRATLDFLFKLDLKNAYRTIARNLTPEVILPKNIFNNCISLYKLDDIKKCFLELMREPDIEIDLETIASRPYEDDFRILTVAIGTYKKAYAFPWLHRQHHWPTGDFDKLKSAFLNFLKNKKQIKRAHNASFEEECLIVEYNDPSLAYVNWKDSMSSAYELGYGSNTDGDEKVFKGLLSLDNLVMAYFGFNLKDYSKVNRVKLDYEPLDKVLTYNAGDVLWGHAVSLKLDEDVHFENLRKITDDHDRRVHAVTLTQYKGYHYDLDHAKDFDQNLMIKSQNIINLIYKDKQVNDYTAKFGRFDATSQKDVIVFFENLGFDMSKPDGKNKDGTIKYKKSSDITVLSKIDHKVAKFLIQFRELEKLKNTYIDCLLPDSKTYVGYPNGWLHPNMTTHFTTTSRTSCTRPNLQNIPKKKNKNIRTIFTAPKDHVYASIDFGQIQFRIFPMVTKDTKLIQSIKDGLDVHGQWSLNIAKLYPKRMGEDSASQWLKNGDFNKLKEDDSSFKEFRDVVKNNFVFPILFGASDRSLSDYMNMPIEVITDLKNMFWSEYPSVPIWHHESYKFYNEHGYITAPSGGRRYGPIEGGEIINYPIQHLEAIIVLDGYCRLSEYAIANNKWQFQPDGMIHDCLDFYLPKSSWEDDLRFIIRTMLGCKYDYINVPLSAEATYGPDLYNQKTYGTFFSDKLNEI